MEMPTIRIDNDVWSYLQSKAKPFVDTPNDVLRREFGIDKKSSDFPVTDKDTEGRSMDAPKVTPGRPIRLSADRDYTHQFVRGYRLNGTSFSAHSFKDVLVGLSNHLRKKHGSNFDKLALNLRGRKRVYFSTDAGELKFPEPVAGGGMFVETNLNANLLMGICTGLLQQLGYDPGQFSIE